MPTPSMDESTYASLALIAGESLVRLRSGGASSVFTNHLNDEERDFINFKYKVYLVFYTLSVLSCFWRDPPFLKVKIIIDSIPLMYAFDSVAVCLLGYSIYYQSRAGLVASMLVLTNVFLLHVLHHIFSGKHSRGTWHDIVTMNKAFIHHSANFLFVDDRSVILIAVIWRAISMSGHTAQYCNLKAIITPTELFDFNWKLSHVRNLTVISILILCYLHEDVRTGFGRSAVGHVAYILVRAGPVYRLGSCYVGDRPQWQGRSDLGRLGELLAGRHPYLTIEVGSLLLLAVAFLCFKFGLK